MIIRILFLWSSFLITTAVIGNFRICYPYLARRDHFCRVPFCRTEFRRSRLICLFFLPRRAVVVTIFFPSKITMIVSVSNGSTQAVIVFDIWMIEMHRVIFDPENVFQSRCFGEIYRASATSTTAVFNLPLLQELKDATQVLKRNEKSLQGGKHLARNVFVSPHISSLSSPLLLGFLPNHGELGNHLPSSAKSFHVNYPLMKKWIPKLGMCRTGSKTKSFIGDDLLVLK